MSIQRYGLDVEDGDLFMNELPFGEYVLYADHAAEVEKFKQNSINEAYQAEQKINDLEKKLAVAVEALYIAKEYLESISK